MTSHGSREAISPRRARMIEDMRIRGFGAKTQYDYIRASEWARRRKRHVGMPVSYRTLPPMAPGDCGRVAGPAPLHSTTGAS